MSQALIERDDMHQIQVLPLVLVEAFDLNVEQAHRIGRDSRFPLYLGCERLPIPPFDAFPLFAEGGVVRHRLERAQLLEVARPAVPDRVSHELGQPGIRQHHEPPRRHAVRHVQELLRPQRAEISQHLAPEELAVKRGDAVDRVASDAREMCHPH